MKLKIEKKLRRYFVFVRTKSNDENQYLIMFVLDKFFYTNLLFYGIFKWAPIIIYHLPKLYSEEWYNK